MSRDTRLDLIEDVYRRRYDAFVRTAAAIANSREAGRDAVHDAFVTAIRHRHTYRGDGTIEAWLWRVVTRSASKRRQAKVEGVSTDDVQDVIWVESRLDVDDDLRVGVMSLPPRQRLLLFLRYYGDLDYRTIARVTGVQVGTVGAELHAAQRSLRRYLEEVTHHA
ncbi:MAG: RNA polymerase sigma factor [Gaiellaceae bacterium]